LDRACGGTKGGRRKGRGEGRGEGTKATRVRDPRSRRRFIRTGRAGGPRVGGGRVGGRAGGKELKLLVCVTRDQGGCVFGPGVRGDRWDEGSGGWGVARVSERGIGRTLSRVLKEMVPRFLIVVTWYTRVFTWSCECLYALLSLSGPCLSCPMLPEGSNVVALLTHKIAPMHDASVATNC